MIVGARPVACRSCLRRSWLLGELSPLLDRNCRADGRLFELLALDDERLIHALGGRRREELVRAWSHFRTRDAEPSPHSSAICVHDERYPRALRDPGAPRLVHVAGGLERLLALTREPLVALLGTGDASDYGLRAAHDLARGLAASGAALVSERRGGIALAVQQGAAEAGGASVLISGDGPGAPPPRARRETYERLALTGCSVSELPGGARGRSWGVAAGVRIAAALATVVVVVEAKERPGDLRGALLARRHGARLAALPGPVGSPTSAGCHALLRDGARLVRSASDVLDLLYGLDETGQSGRLPSEALPSLRPAPRELLMRVSEGAETLGKLTAGQSDRAQVLRDLGELELSGLLSRSEGGRYRVARPDPTHPLR